MKEIDKNWIYRYRSMSALSLKELMYDELYFSYADELNDPLDLGAELIIGAGASYVYEYFISSALKAATLPRVKDILATETEFSKKISEASAINTNNVKVFFTEEYGSWVRREYEQAMLDPLKYYRFYKYLINIVLNLFPNNLLSASFSRDCGNPLLWSIYSGAHTGFSLIFSPNAGSLRLRKFMEVEYEDYKYQSVNYSNNLDVDLSLMFSDKQEFEWDRLFNNYFPSLVEKALLTKNSNWYKENESRIHLGINTNFSHLESAPEKLAPVEKTYYYDTAQFVGVIFGYKMNQADRLKVKEIFKAKKQTNHLFEAIPCGNEMKVCYIGGEWYCD